MHPMGDWCMVLTTSGKRAQMHHANMLLCAADEFCLSYSYRFHKIYLAKRGLGHSVWVCLVGLESMSVHPLIFQTFWSVQT